MTSSQRPALGISLRSALPQRFVDEFSAEVRRDDLRIDVREQGSGVFAGLEWLMETALVIYIVRLIWTLCWQRWARTITVPIGIELFAQIGTVGTSVGTKYFVKKYTSYIKG